MPSFEMFKKMNGGLTVGQRHKADSDMIMEATWDNDIDTRVAYFYDFDHDSHITQLNDLSPEQDENKIPISIKFIAHTKQTLSKDFISYHLQLKQSQSENVIPYYKEKFKERYGATFPIGMYLDIPDNKGRYNRWLVVSQADYNDVQFSDFELLRCDYVFQWVIDGKKMQMAGVLRSQSSYNSGVWVDYRIESPEDQQKCLLPMTRETEKLFYNQRLIIDNRVLTEPRVWVITKPNRIANKGICGLTFAQDVFDPHKDFIEMDEDGNVIGMWADYFDNGLAPEDHVDYDGLTCELSVVGNKRIKIDGGYKRLSVEFYKNGVPTEFKEGYWNYYVDGTDVSLLVEELTDGLAKNERSIRFIGTDDYIGKILTVVFTAGSVFDDVELSITGL